MLRSPKHANHILLVMFVSDDFISGPFPWMPSKDCTRSEFVNFRYRYETAAQSEGINVAALASPNS